MKKILALSLVLTLIFGMLSVATFSADEYSPDDDIISGDYNYEFLEDGTIGINNYLGTADEVEVPSEIDGYKVTALHRYSFAGHENLRKVTIPEGITRIGYWAFEDCFNLEEIILPDSLREMHKMYIDETKLYKTAENWENGVLYVGKHLVDTNPKKISGTFTVKEGTIAITQLAFDGCKELTEVILPDSVKYIGDSAFRDCDNLTKINLTDNITFLDFAAFDGCPLEEVHIPNTLKTIEPYVFRGTAITEVTIPESVEAIRYSAFQNCDGLTEITVPDSVKEIDDYVFLSCDNLSSITLPENLENLGYAVISSTAYANDENNWEDGILYFGDMLMDAEDEISGNIKIKDGTRLIAANAFWDNDNIASVTIPDSVEIIGRGCFSACENLKSVKLSKSITEIPSGLFNGCLGLESFTIPENVKTIGDNAFFDCISLKYIVIPESVESFGTDAVGYYNPYYGDGSVVPLEYSKVKDLVIAGYKGSAAESYAKEHGFAFEDLSAPTLNNKYKDKVLEILELSENENDTIHLAHYQEIYGHTTNDGQKAPDFVLIKVYNNLCVEADFTYRFGDYVMYESSTSTPFELGYGIYIPEEDKVYSLVEAWEMGIENLDVLFKKGYIGKLTGDVNFDEKLNIRDATAIQKHIANIESLYAYPEFGFEANHTERTHVDRIADFNGDYKISVRDATAIQKRLAGVEINNPDYDDFEKEAYESTIKHSNVTINGETYPLRSDEIMSVEVKLTCDKPIKNLSFDIKYNGDAIKTVTTGSAEDYLKAHCPNLSKDSELRTNYGYTYINVPEGEYNFTEGKILYKMDYTVNHEFDTNLDFNLLTAFDAQGNQICYSSIPTPDTNLTLSYYVTITRITE